MATPPTATKPAPAPAASAPAPMAADPAKAKALYERGLAVEKGGDIRAGIRLYYLAIEADPDYAPVRNHLAWLRATNPKAELRDGAEAVRLSERACKVAVDENKPTIFAANCLDTLAAAYAEAGRFDDAVRAARRAVAMAETLGNRGAARSFRSRLELFQNKRPHHDR